MSDKVFEGMALLDEDGFVCTLKRKISDSGDTAFRAVRTKMPVSEKFVDFQRRTHTPAPMSIYMAAAKEADDKYQNLLGDVRQAYIIVYDLLKKHL